jgi:hypothetical protein
MLVVAVVVCGVISFLFLWPEPSTLPADPVLAVVIGGFALATIAASVAVLLVALKREGRRHSRGRKVFVWVIVWLITAFLWASASAESGPAPEGGMTAYTQGGILHYLTVTSGRSDVGAAWSHDVAIHLWPLAGTVALNVAVMVVVVYIARGWRISAYQSTTTVEGNG